MIDGYVHPAFAGLAARFSADFTGRGGNGGGALCVRRHGETVVDIWVGHADRAGTRPWTADTPVMCFSMTKGFAATVIHRLVDRGDLAIDQTVASVWPAFAANGKADITIRQMLSHRAGLHDIRRIVKNADDLLDNEGMEARLAAASPHPRLLGHCAYHALTFGWLASGIARAVTGQDLRALFRTEISEPLGIGGIHLGRPEPGTSDPVADLVFSERQFAFVGRLAERGARRSKMMKAVNSALIVDGFDELIKDMDGPVLDAQMPAVNGTFTARGASAMYAALAGGGSWRGRQLLSRRTVHEAGRVQSRERDAVLMLDMRWRLGYHAALTTGRRPPRGFGHFGYGGSGAWADPDTGLAVAFVTNRLGSVTTPVADLRLLRYGGDALKAVRAMDGAAPTTVVTDLRDAEAS